MYIMYGKPDEIEAHPSGGSYDRPQDEGGGQTSTFPLKPGAIATWKTLVRKSSLSSSIPACAANIT